MLKEKIAVQGKLSTEIETTIASTLAFGQGDVKAKRDWN
jgi:hypothetical protein